MTPKFLNGVASISLGAIAADGTPATIFTAIGNTVVDTAVFKQAPDSNTDYYIEEVQSPVFTAVKKGAITFSFSCYDVELSNLVKFFGGTLTGTAPNQIWNAPDAIVPQNLTVQIVAVTGQALTINNAYVSAILDFNFGRTKIGQISFVCTVLQPIKAGVPRFSIGND